MRNVCVSVYVCVRLCVCMCVCVTHSSPRLTSGIPDSIWLDNISSVLDFDLKSILSGSLYSDLTLAS